MPNIEKEDNPNLKDYIKFEQTMVKYRDLIEIPVKENNEQFILLPKINNGVVGIYADFNDMAKEFPQIPVRFSVKNKLDEVNNIITKKIPHFRLNITYGYRSLEIQEKYFQEKKALLSQTIIPIGSTLEEEVHRLIAVPFVSGHPTGGAIDAYIIDTNTNLPIDFGSNIYDFETKDSYALSPYIRPEAQQNRILLREAMMSQGFAPYDGEWWHFSYGDKEWAFYYKKPFAIYTQKETLEVKNTIKNP